MSEHLDLAEYFLNRAKGAQETDELANHANLSMASSLLVIAQLLENSFREDVKSEPVEKEVQKKKWNK